jgi:Fe-S cluster biogenesis protein NfuA
MMVRVEGPSKEIVSQICRDVLAPLVRADGGELYLVQIAGDDVHIHLSGTCAGCPGASLTRDKVLGPIITAAMPKARITLTTGFRIPDGATKC